tara:strand:- start:144 stop:386 length:243 start_codon:yes stop_codon:yes gene_type:complete
MEFMVDSKNKYINSLMFKEETGCELYLRDNVLYVSGAKSQKEADDFLAAHNPTPTPEPSVEDKLASVGLNLDDLKSALGL